MGFKQDYLEIIKGFIALQFSIWKNTRSVTYLLAIVIQLLRVIGKRRVHFCCQERKLC